jgi:hypothetical protein
MKPIGGFFELENIRKREMPFLHQDAISLSSGRASLNFILKTLRPSLVYVPFYTCNALLQPIWLNNIAYEFYPINEHLEPAGGIELQDGQYLIYINYFGIKSAAVENLISKFGNKLIVDNSQAFFEPEHRGIFSFNSARKFFGVPDGSFFYSPVRVAETFEENENYSTNHLINRALGNFETAYKEFQDYGQTISCEVRKISTLAHKILKTIDYERVAEIRKRNYLYLQDQLGIYNRMDSYLDSKKVPLCYPLLPDRFMDKKKFYENGIYIPTFWEDVVERDGSRFQFEKKLSRALLPLPVDHRYNEKDLGRVSQFVKEYLQQG